MIQLNVDDLKGRRDMARASGRLENWGDLMLEWAAVAAKAAGDGEFAMTVLAEADRLLYDWVPKCEVRQASREYVMTRIDRALEGAPRHPSALPGEGSWEKE